MGTALLLYPNQLFEVSLLPKVQRVYLVEEPLLFGTDKEFPMSFHKQRLVLLRASMRRYAEEVLWPNGYEVEYVESGTDVVTDTALVRAAFEGASEIVVFDPIDLRLWRRLESASQALEVHVPLRKLENPGFYLRQKDIDAYFTGKDTPSFTDFYQYQRERFDVLIDKNYHPVGGKWSFESEEETRLDKDTPLPGISSFGDNDFVREAITHVELKFPSNPGRTDTFLWPTNRVESLAWLKDFFANRLSSYGEYQDIVDERGVWLFHSAISPMLNIGLVSPQEVVEAAMDFCASTKKEIPIASLEGFIRNILGQREYARALYVTSGDKLRSQNVLGNNRRLTDDWYAGTTGMPPVDAVIKKVNDFGYAHHSERLTVVGNFMMMCDIHPDDVYQWFMCSFVDSYEWVTLPSVYSLGQSIQQGKLSGRQSLCSSNTILAMSRYDKGPWCDIWDGLFWRFVDGHRLMVKKVPRLGSLLLSRYDKMDASRKRIIGYRGQDFLDLMTSNPDN